MTIAEHRLNRRDALLGAGVVSAGALAALMPSGFVAADDNFVQRKIAFEFVGQVTNFAPIPAAPLGTSNQYGYLTVVRGIDNVFSGSPHSETTASLTFFMR